MSDENEADVSAAVKWVVRQAQEAATARAAKMQARKESLVNPKRK